MHELIITIDEEAQTTIEVKGHAGPGCKALTQQIEAALGTVTDDKETHEYRQRAQQQQTATATR